MCVAENDTPSAIDMASSDDEVGDDTTGGLSKVESFSDDPTVEIMRLKALLSQREDELEREDDPARATGGPAASVQRCVAQTSFMPVSVVQTSLNVPGMEWLAPMDLCAQRS